MPAARTAPMAIPSCRAATTTVSTSGKWLSRVVRVEQCTGRDSTFFSICTLARNACRANVKAKLQITDCGLSTCFAYSPSLSAQHNQPKAVQLPKAVRASRTRLRSSARCCRDIICLSITITLSVDAQVAERELCGSMFRQTTIFDCPAGDEVRRANAALFQGCPRTVASCEAR